MSNRIQIGVRLPEDLVIEVDRCRLAMPFPPDRTTIIEKLLEQWLQANQQKKGGRK